MLTDNLQEDIYDLLCNIRDPELPSTLGELSVIKIQDIVVHYPRVDVFWTPTVSHCAFAFQIALSIRVKLQRELLGYSTMKFKVLVKPGTHTSEHTIDKQSNDKERVRAAMENHQLMDFIERLI